MIGIPTVLRYPEFFKTNEANIIFQKGFIKGLDTYCNNGYELTYSDLGRAAKYNRLVLFKYIEDQNLQEKKRIKLI